jgi:hypothetical protein
MGPFMLLLLFNLFYFLVVIAVTVAVFYFAYTSGNPRVFLIYLAAVIALNFFLTRAAFLKWRLGLNVHFIRFLSRLEKEGDSVVGVGPAKVNLPASLRETFKEIREKLRKIGVEHVSFRILIVVAAAYVTGGGVLPADLPAFRRLRQAAFRLYLLEVLGFLVLLAPFVLISFFLTMGMAVAVKGLVYALGFFFAWFLHAGLVRPIISLTLQKRARQL